MSEIQGKPVYGVCECNEKKQVLSIDQVTDLIQQMAANGWQVPADYIPKTSVNGIIEQHEGRELKLWIGTQAKWDEFTGDKKNVFAIISDDPTLKNILNKLDEHGAAIISVNNRVDGLNTKFSADTVTSFGDCIVPKVKKVWEGEVGTGADGDVWTDIVIDFDITKDTEFIVQFKDLTTTGCIYKERFYLNANTGILSGIPYSVYSNSGCVMHSVPVWFKDINTIRFSAARLGTANYMGIVIQGIWAIIE